MSTEPLPIHLRVALAVAAALEAADIDYMLCGSMASSLRGEARTTYDLDLVIDITEEQVSDLAEALESEFLVDEEQIRMAARSRASCNVLHSGTALRVDLFALKARSFSQEEFRRRKAVRIGNGSSQLYVTSREDLVLTKLEWFRKGGEVSERQWRDVLGLLAAGRDELENEYLDHWAEELGLRALLARARAESAGS